MDNTHIKNKGNKKGGNSNPRNNNNKPTNTRPQQNGKKPGRPCKHCQKTHMDYECPTLKNKNNHNNNNNNKHQILTSKDGKAIVCHHCQGNHYDSKCPNRKHDSSNGSFQQILIDNKSGKAISCKFCQGNHFNKNCPLKNPQNAGDTSMGNSPYNNTIGVSNNRGGKDPKRPCKFCQGLHWDTECPSRGGNQSGRQQQGQKAPFIPKDATQRLHPKEQQRIQNIRNTIQKWAPNHESRGMIESFLQANFRKLLDSNLWNEAFEQFLRETYIEFSLETYYNFLTEQVKNEEQKSYIYHFVLDSKQQLCDQDTPSEEFVLSLYFQSKQYRDYMTLVETKALKEIFLQGGQRSTTLEEAARADFNDQQFLNYIRNIGDNNQKALLSMYTDIQRGENESFSTGTRCEECGGAHSYGCCPRRQGHRSSWCCISVIQSGDSFYSELEKSLSEKKTSDPEWYDTQEVVMTKKSMITEVEYEIDRAGDAIMTEVDERCEICRSYLSVDEFGMIKDRWLYDLDHECVSSCERIAAGQHSDLIEKSHRMWDSPWAILGHVPQGSHVW